MAIASPCAERVVDGVRSYSIRIRLRSWVTVRCFSELDRTRYGADSRSLLRLLESADSHLNTFRRTCASLVLLAGMDSRHIRTLGGWSSERVFSERYVAYVLEEAALVQAERLALTTQLLDRPVSATA